MSQNFATSYGIYLKEEWKNKSGLIDPTLFDYLETEEKELYRVFRIGGNDDISKLQFEGNDKLNVVFYTESITFDQSFNIPELIQEKKENFIIIGKIDLGDNIFIEFKIYNYKEGWGKKYNILFNVLEKHPGKPVVFPDIQTIIKKRLLFGLNIYGTQFGEELSERLKTHSKREVDEILFSSDNVRSRRLFSLKTFTKLEKEEQFHENHKLHYQRFFYDERLGEPKVFLTNSGVSSNDTVLIHIVKEVPQLERWKSFDFYYENLPPFMRNHTSLNEKTQVFLASPSILTPRPGIDIKKFTKTLKRDILYFIQNVKNNPDKKYYFVFDITTNLTLSLQDYFTEIPDNLTIVKTYSLTKHQRGDTQYFFGGISLYGNDDGFQNAIPQIIDNQGYNLTREQVLHYPRVRRTEINKNLDNIAKNRRAFKSSFTRYLNKKGLDKLMPKIIDSDYFSIVLIPLPEILYYRKHGDIPKKKMTDIPEDLHLLITSGQNVEGNIIGNDKSYVNSFIFPQILPTQTTIKDTFGLKTHNICSYFSNIGLLYFDEFNPKFKKIESPRISFSIKKDIKGAFELGKKFGEMYFAWILEILEVNK
ncbi:MAG: hypothetical protein PHI37_05845 [Candidatus Gracilibacteria bacterium]|nr:hypothetical protein [Candidatus Gracilibacteria bacterium]